jgi:hypothetical protein
MLTDRTRTILSRVALILGAMALLAAGADHLDEYAANGFSTVPTIGTLFLLNFLAATLIGVGLLVPWEHLVKRLARPVRSLLALGGIGVAATSLIGLWISETSSLFGFTDYGFRSTIVVAIVAETITIVGLSAYLALDGVRLLGPPPRLRSH